MKTENLQTVENQAIRVKILEAIICDGAGVEDVVRIASESGMDALGLVDLISEPSFLGEVRKVTFARASLAVHGRGIDDLILIAKSGKRDHDRLTAWRTLATMTGDLIHKHQHVHRVTFEDMRSRAGGRLSGLFDIRSDVIEGQIEDDCEQSSDN